MNPSVEQVAQQVSSSGYSLYQKEIDAFSEKKVGSGLLLGVYLRGHETASAIGGVAKNIFMCTFGAPIRCASNCFIVQDVNVMDPRPGEAPFVEGEDVCSLIISAQCGYGVLAFSDLMRVPLAPLCPEVDYGILRLERRRNCLEGAGNGCVEPFERMLPFPPNCRKPSEAPLPQVMGDAT